MWGKETAAKIRADIRAAQKAGRLDPTLKISVTRDLASLMDGVDIRVTNVDPSELCDDGVDYPDNPWTERAFEIADALEPIVAPYRAETDDRIRFISIHGLPPARSEPLTAHAPELHETPHAAHDEGAPQRRTVHEPGVLRFQVVGPRGTIELRVETVIAAVVFPNGDAECLLGAEIANLWRATDCDDELVWKELERCYDNVPPLAEAPRYVVDTPAVAQQRRTLREAAQWSDFAQGHHFAEEEIAQAEQAHQAALRELIRRLDEARGTQ